MGNYYSSIKYIEKHNIEKTINTEVNVDVAKMGVKTEETKENIKAKPGRISIRELGRNQFNPFLIGNIDIDTGNITNIIIKNSRIFGFYPVILGILFSTCVIYTIWTILFFDGNGINLLIDFVPLFAFVIWILSFVLIESGTYKYKSIKIKLKNEKPIYIPIEGGNFKESGINDFIFDLKCINPNIKVSKTIERNSKIKILIFLISLALGLSLPNIKFILINLGIVAVFAIPLYLLKLDFDKKLIKSVLLTILMFILSTTCMIIVGLKLDNHSNNYNINTSNVKVDVYEGKLVKSIHVSRYSYNNTYFIEEENKKLRFKESSPRTLNQSYYIWSTSYLSDNGKVLKEEYETSKRYSEYNFINMNKGDVEYLYNCVSHKMYRFYDPQYNYNSKKMLGNNSYTLVLYQNNKPGYTAELVNLYKFIQLEKSQNLQEMEKYKNLIKIVNAFDSKYGKCFVLAYGNITANRTKYYMFMQNDQLNSGDGFDGIFLIYQKNILLDENVAIKYFKAMVGTI